MKETVDNSESIAFSAERGGDIGARVFLTMAVAVGLACVVSALIAPWRVTTGLFVGGLLSLLNYHWLRNSISAGFSLVLDGTKPRITLVAYVLRYFVVAATVFVAYKLNIVSLPATIVGLCSFAIALFVEALREFYFAIIHREGIS